MDNGYDPNNEEMIQRFNEWAEKIAENKLPKELEYVPDTVAMYCCFQCHKIISNEECPEEIRCDCGDFHGQYIWCHSINAPNLSFPILIDKSIAYLLNGEMSRENSQR